MPDPCELRVGERYQKEWGNSDEMNAPPIIYNNGNRVLVGVGESVKSILDKHGNQVFVRIDKNGMPILDGFGNPVLAPIEAPKSLKDHGMEPENAPEKDKFVNNHKYHSEFNKIFERKKQAPQQFLGKLQLSRKVFLEKQFSGKKPVSNTVGKDDTLGLGIIVTKDKSVLAKPTAKLNSMMRWISELLEGDPSFDLTS